MVVDCTAEYGTKDGTEDGDQGDDRDDVPPFLRWDKFGLDTCYHRVDSGATDALQSPEHNPTCIKDLVYKSCHYVIIVLC